MLNNLLKYKIFFLCYFIHNFLGGNPQTPSPHHMLLMPMLTKYTYGVIWCSKCVQFNLVLVICVNQVVVAWDGVYFLTLIIVPVQPCKTMIQFVLNSPPREAVHVHESCS